MKKTVTMGGDTTDWRTVAAALALGVVAALHIGKVPPALPEIRTEMNLDLVGGGFIVSTFNVLGMLLGLVMGRFADQIGRRKTATLGCIFFVVGGGFGALAGGLPIILASRAIEGLGFMAIAVTMPSIVAEVASKRDRSFALGLWSIFMPLGFSIALLVTPVLLSVAGWRMLWGGLAALSLLSMLLLLPNLRVARQNAADVPHQRFSEVLGQPRLWLLSAAFGAYVFQWVTLMAWLPTFLIGTLGYSLGGASVATALVVAANVPGNLLAGVLMRSGAPPSWLITIGSTTMAIAAAGLFLGTSFAPLTGLGLCLLFSFLGGTHPIGAVCSDSARVAIARLCCSSERNADAGFCGRSVRRSATDRCCRRRVRWRVVGCGHAAHRDGRSDSTCRNTGNIAAGGAGTWFVTSLQA